MLILRKYASARAGLVGNPSDGYGGKTISVEVPQFRAGATLYGWDEVEVVLSQEDQSRFASMDDLVRDVALHGYYGGVRLVKATLKKFAEFCRRHGHELHDRNFSIRYETNIPRQVGLGGSSAIIIATLRCLMDFYQVEIPLAVQPSLALSVETEELGITAGLQDRVAQVYGGLVYMDFSPERTRTEQGFSCGHYEPLSLDQLPPLYLAYSRNASEPTEVFHNDLRGRYDRGEPEVVDAISQIAALAEKARSALANGDHASLAELMDRNFDLRAGICRLPTWQSDMVATARQAGACAKFAGSGGAIVGICPDDETLAKLKTALGAVNCEVLRIHSGKENQRRPK